MYTWLYTLQYLPEIRIAQWWCSSTAVQWATNDVDAADVVRVDTDVVPALVYCSAGTGVLVATVNPNQHGPF